MNVLCYHSVSYKVFNTVFKDLRNEGKSFSLFGIVNEIKPEYNFEEVHQGVLKLSKIKRDSEKEEFEKLIGYEKKYNLSISNYINAERHLVSNSREEKRRVGYAIANKLIEYVVDNKINVIFSEGVDDFPSFLLFDLAKSLGIRFNYLIFARIGKRLYLSNRLDTGPEGLEENHAENLKLVETNPELFKETKEFIYNYVTNKSQPSYMDKALKKGKSISIFKKIGNTIKKVKSNYRYSKSNSDSYAILSFKDILKKQRLKRKNVKGYLNFIKNNAYTLDEIPTEKYFIYPLHFHPEGATLILGRWLNDQYAIIEMIAKNLPLDVTLVVKEHRVSIGWRETSFFEKANKLHNVYFVSHLENPYDLLQKSIGVFTISSSMGLEAMLLNKAVVSFGDVMYNQMKGIIFARDISKIKESILKALEFEGYKESDKLAFIQTLLEGSFEIDRFNFHDGSKKSMDAIKEQIIKKIF